VEKYAGTFADGHRQAVWAIDEEHARLHLHDWCRLHGNLVEVTLLIPCMEDRLAENTAKTAAA